MFGNHLIFIFMNMQLINTTVNQLYICESGVFIRPGVHANPSQCSVCSPTIESPSTSEPTPPKTSNHPEPRKPCHRLCRPVVSKLLTIFHLCAQIDFIFVHLASPPPHLPINIFLFLMKCDFLHVVKQGPSSEHTIGG